MRDLSSQSSFEWAIFASKREETALESCPKVVLKERVRTLQLSKQFSRPLQTLIAYRDSRRVDRPFNERYLNGSEAS